LNDRYNLTNYKELTYRKKKATLYISKTIYSYVTSSDL